MDFDFSFLYSTLDEQNNSSNHSSIPFIPIIETCSAPTLLIFFGHLCWLITFSYLRRTWNPKRKMMSNVHIESVALIIFHLAYRLPCIIHMFSFDNPYINRKDCEYLVLPIFIVLIYVIAKVSRYAYLRINYPQDYVRDDVLIAEPCEFHEETIDLPNRHRLSRRKREHYFALGEYQSIEGQEDCKNPYNIPRLPETQMTLNLLMLFSVISLILGFVNPDTCFQEDPIPRFLLCAVHAGHLTSVINKRIKYHGIEKPITIAVFVVIILAIGFCMFHVYQSHKTIKVGMIIAFEIIFGAVTLYIVINNILLRYMPTKFDLLRTILCCLPYMVLTISTVVAGMKKIKVGQSLSNCT